MAGSGAAAPDAAQASGSGPDSGPAGSSFLASAGLLGPAGESSHRRRGTRTKGAIVAAGVAVVAILAISLSSGTAPKSATKTVPAGHATKTSAPAAPVAAPATSPAPSGSAPKAAPKHSEPASGE